MALGSHITTGDALPATNSKKSLFAGREIRIFSMVKYVLREKRGTYLKDYNYQPAFSLVNQISFKLRLNAVTCLCSTATHSEAPANEREEKYDNDEEFKLTASKPNHIFLTFVALIILSASFQPFDLV